MGSIRANCAICAKPLIYLDTSRDVTCSICGKGDRGRCICEDGHYVCDSCHRRRGVDSIMDTCLQSKSADPISLAMEIMENDPIYPNGPEHHSLVGAVLLCAYANSGGSIELREALHELRERSMQLPGGTCGYWGICGAAASAGQFHSIVTGATPLSDREWADSARLTSAIISRLSEIGGPRCCKRSTFVSIIEGARHVKEGLGVEMGMPDNIRCSFMDGNAQCKGGDCPFFPRPDARYSFDDSR